MCVTEREGERERGVCNRQKEQVNLSKPFSNMLSGNNVMNLLSMKNKPV